jgi:hypothetical protein
LIGCTLGNDSWSTFNVWLYTVCKDIGSHMLYM